MPTLGPGGGARRRHQPTFDEPSTVARLVCRGRACVESRAGTITSRPMFGRGIACSWPGTRASDRRPARAVSGGICHTHMRRCCDSVDALTPWTASSRTRCKRPVQESVHESVHESPAPALSRRRHECQPSRHDYRSLTVQQTRHTALVVERRRCVETSASPAGPLSRGHGACERDAASLISMRSC